MYHTQEKRARLLTAPIPCSRNDAWLGLGYYFWYSEGDAVYWGNRNKRKTGYFEIYRAEIEVDNILDTVFNEEHYLFWVEQIEKIAKKLIKAGRPVSLKAINDFFYVNGVWKQVDGILFQDISSNPEHYFVKEFQYKKRIQLAVFNLDIITNFALKFEGKCV